MEVTIEALRPIPSIALLPIALIALGFGYRMEIVIVAFACIWPLLILSRAAVGSIEPRLIEVSRALRLSPRTGSARSSFRRRCRGFSWRSVSPPASR
jgi:ABC-type nitrate/sulfonate/bicarbonate transport system permease component